MAASVVYAELDLDSRDCRSSGSLCLEWREWVHFVRGGGPFSLRLLHLSVTGLLPLRSLSSSLTGVCVDVLAGVCAPLSVVRAATIGDSAASGDELAACRSCKG